MDDKDWWLDHCEADLASQGVSEERGKISPYYDKALGAYFIRFFIELDFIAPHSFIFPA